MNTNNPQLTKKIRRAIMRRVWYAYTLSIVLRQSALWGLAFGASVIGFWKLVSITSIIENFLNVPVGEAPSYVIHSMMQAEFLALAAFGFIVFTILSVGVKVGWPEVRTGRQMQSI
jgi:hypothetical protein